MLGLLSFKFKAIAFAIALAGAALFIWHYKHTISENKRLHVEILAANSTIEMLDRKIEEEAEITQATDKIINEVRNAPETDDAIAAPVLARVLDRL